jgi:hypothetical protein
VGECLDFGGPLWLVQVRPPSQSPFDNGPGPMAALICPWPRSNDGASPFSRLLLPRAPRTVRASGSDGDPSRTIRRRARQIARTVVPRRSRRSLGQAAARPLLERASRALKACGLAKALVDGPCATALLQRPFCNVARPVFCNVARPAAGDGPAPLWPSAARGLRDPCNELSRRSAEKTRGCKGTWTASAIEAWKRPSGCDPCPQERAPPHHRLARARCSRVGHSRLFGRCPAAH